MPRSTPWCATISRRAGSAEPHCQRRAGLRPPPAQAFCQAFPNLACFRPRISKHSFGRFVGFQGVTRVPNPKCPSPNFFASPAARTTRWARRRVVIVQRHGKTVARVSVFRKRNRCCLLRAHGVSCDEPKRRRKIVNEVVSPYSTTTESADDPGRPVSRVDNRPRPRAAPPSRGVPPGREPRADRKGSRPFACIGWRRELKDGAAGQVLARPQSSAVSFYDRTADRQPHTHAVSFCRVEGIEQALEARWRQPRTRIPHRDEHAVRLGRPGADQRFSRAVTVAAHRLQGVDDQVEDHLLQLNPISLNER